MPADGSCDSMAAWSRRKAESVASAACQAEPPPSVLVARAKLACASCTVPCQARTAAVSSCSEAFSVKTGFLNWSARHLHRRHAKPLIAPHHEM